MRTSQVIAVAVKIALPVVLLVLVAKIFLYQYDQETQKELQATRADVLAKYYPKLRLEEPADGQGRILSVCQLNYWPDPLTQASVDPVAQNQIDRQLLKKKPRPFPHNKPHVYLPSICTF